MKWLAHAIAAQIMIGMGKYNCRRKIIQLGVVFSSNSLRPHCCKSSADSEETSSAVSGAAGFLRCHYSIATLRG